MSVAGSVVKSLMLLTTNTGTDTAFQRAAYPDGIQEVTRV